MQTSDDLARHGHGLIQLGMFLFLLALLGRNNPFGVVLAALLFGGLKSGASQMQLRAGIPASIISVVQGLILLFVAADVIIRWLYRIRVKSEAQTMTLQPAAVLAAEVSSGTTVADAPRDVESRKGPENL